MKKSNFIKMLFLSSLIMGAMIQSVFAASNRGWMTDGYDWFYLDGEERLTETIKSSGDEKFYLNYEGVMVRDYLLEDYNSDTYYFDDSGKMVKNTWVAVDPSQVESNMDNPPSIYLYYFGPNGKAFKASSGVVRKTIDGKRYLFNEYGQMLSGWINESGEKYNEFDTDEDPFIGFCYYAGDETDGVLREGWSAYDGGSVDDKYYLRDVLWFYFSPSNNKKICSDSSSTLKKKVVNNRTYGFDENGVMLQGWDSDAIEGLGTTSLYFSENTDDQKGRMHKKEWIFAVPSEEQEPEDHDQEVSRWFYANGSGDIVKDTMKKINTNYYAFNEKGIMRKGLCVIDANTREYVDCIDTEKTDGKDFIMSRSYISLETYKDKNGTTDVYELFNDKTQKLYYFNEDETSDKYGERIIGDVAVAFGDNDYIFSSNNAGEFEGEKKSKYYQAGIRLAADKGLGLGLVLVGYSTSSNAAGVSIRPEYLDSTNVFAGEDVNHVAIDPATGEPAGGNNKTDYVVKYNPDASSDGNTYYPVFKVVDGNGRIIDKSNTTRKDKSGNYWMIGPGGTFVKVFNVPIKYSKSSKKWYYKSEQSNASNKVKSTWIEFCPNPSGPDTSIPTDLKYLDIYNNWCSPTRNKGNYEFELDEVYCTNFRWSDN